MKAFIVAVVLLIAVAGCGKDKKITGPGPGPGPTYAVPSTPYRVLSNLTVAYSRLDSTQYKALFDDNYAGTSLDHLTIPISLDSIALTHPNRPLTWTRNTKEKLPMLTRLFDGSNTRQRISSVSSISTRRSASTWESLPMRLLTRIQTRTNRCAFMSAARTPSNSG